MIWFERFHIGLAVIALGLCSCSVLRGTERESAARGFLLKDGDIIVFLGDSITQAATRPGGYITLFATFCAANGLEVKTINAGISGHKSNDMLKRLQRDVLDHKPTWVSISCGVNDVWHGVKGVPLPEYKKNMTEIVDRCKAAGVRVLLLTATPIYENLDSAENKKLANYNDFLRQLAKEKKLVLCDLNKAFREVYEKKTTKENVLTTDGVHMKPSGYRLMATEILKALRAAPSELLRAEREWDLRAKP